MYQEKLPASLYHILDVHKILQCLKIGVAGNFFGCMVMNQTKVICDSILVIGSVVVPWGFDFTFKV